MPVNEETLLALIQDELDRLNALVTPSADNPFMVEIPDPEQVDTTLGELASLVARTSNNYARLARLAGMARAHAKIAKGRFERKHKAMRTSGANERERAADAMRQCLSEHTEMTAAEAMAEIAESLETAARLASESARKLYDKSHAMLEGETRSWRAGGVSAADFSEY